MELRTILGELDLTTLVFGGVGDFLGVPLECVVDFWYELDMRITPHCCEQRQCSTPASGGAAGRCPRQYHQERHSRHR